MKINEILELDAEPGAPGDEPEMEMSPYVEKIKGTLVDYLASLHATGAQKPLPTQMMVNFLKRMGHDVTPEQVDELLADTPFGGSPDEINIAGSQQGDMKGRRDPEFNKQKVKSMANQKIKKTDFDHNDFGDKDWRKGGVI